MASTYQNDIKEIGIMAMIESEDELVQVCLEVLGRDTVVDTNDRSLEEGPEGFDAHGMDVAFDEGLGMADGPVRESFGSLPVSLVFVGAEQFGIETDVGIEQGSERFSGEVLNDLGYSVTASLDHSDNDLLAGSTTATLPAGSLATDVGVVGFDDSSELIFEPIPWPHGLADLHSHSPCGFVCDSEGSFELFRADALLGVDHEPDGCKPLLKGCAGSMKDGSGSDRELIGTGFAAPYVTGTNPVGVRGSTTRTGNAIGPTLATKEFLALALGGEAILQLDNVHDSSLWKEYSTIRAVSKGDKALPDSRVPGSFCGQRAPGHPVQYKTGCPWEGTQGQV